MSKKKLKLRDCKVGLMSWPGLEGTISAETAQKAGIKVPECMKGKRIKLNGI